MSATAAIPKSTYKAWNDGSGEPAPVAATLLWPDLTAACSSEHRQAGRLLPEIRLHRGLRPCGGPAAKAAATGSWGQDGKHVQWRLAAILRFPNGSATGLSPLRRGRWAGAANEHGGPVYGPNADTASTDAYNLSAMGGAGIPQRRTFVNPTPTEGDDRELWGQGRPQGKDSNTAWSTGTVSDSQGGIMQPVTSVLMYSGTVTGTDMSRVTDAREKSRIGIYGTGLSYAGSYGRVTSEIIGRDLNPLGRGDGMAYVGGGNSPGYTVQNLGPIYPVLPGAKQEPGFGQSVNNPCGGGPCASPVAADQTLPYDPEDLPPHLPENRVHLTLYSKCDCQGACDPGCGKWHKNPCCGRFNPWTKTCDCFNCLDPIAGRGDDPKNPMRNNWCLYASKSLVGSGSVYDHCENKCSSYQGDANTDQNCTYAVGDIWGPSDDCLKPLGSGRLSDVEGASVAAALMAGCIQGLISPYQACYGMCVYCKTRSRKKGLRVLPRENPAPVPAPAPEPGLPPQVEPHPMPGPAPFPSYDPNDVYANDVVVKSLKGLIAGSAAAAAAVVIAMAIIAVGAEAGVLAGLGRLAPIAR